MTEGELIGSKDEQMFQWAWPGEHLSSDRPFVVTVRYVVETWHTIVFSDAHLLVFVGRWNGKGVVIGVSLRQMIGVSH